jgi:putative oxidoreductase
MDKLITYGPAVARVVMGLFFWVNAAGLVKDFKMVTVLMASKGVPAQTPLLIVTIAAWVVGGAALVFGRNVVPACMVLFALTALMTPIIHNFWAAPPELTANEIQHFFKNVAILAGLLSIATAAAGASIGN